MLLGNYTRTLRKVVIINTVTLLTVNKAAVTKRNRYKEINRYFAGLRNRGINDIKEKSY